jgi:endonuclease YncB( thermonuclease family)
VYYGARRRAGDPVTESRIRAWLPLALLLLGAAAFLAYGSAKGADPRPRLSPRVETRLGSGFVVRVADGDTLSLADGRKIRLAQIDAPELSTRECYAEQARATLEKLAAIGGEVTPILDPALDIRDEHGRLLAYVLKDGTNLNLRLVEIGAAAPYFYRGARGRLADELVAAARKARADRRGLWGACPGTQLDPTRQVDTGRQ